MTPLARAVNTAPLFHGYGWLIAAAILFALGLASSSLSLYRTLTLNRKREKFVAIAARLATLYWLHADRADYLVRQLEHTWHQWNNVGEKLIYPIGEKAGLSPDCTDWARLVKMNQFFYIMYEDHIVSLKEYLPDFSSSITALQVPADFEYHLLMFELKQHAKQLRENGNDSWKAVHENHLPEGVE